MKGKRFTEEQIIRILQEAESGLAVADVCRKYNCSEQSFYRWKAKYLRGKLVRFSGWGNDWLLRLYNRNSTDLIGKVRCCPRNCQTTGRWRSQKLAG